MRAGNHPLFPAPAHHDAMSVKAINGLSIVNGVNGLAKRIRFATARPCTKIRFTGIFRSRLLHIQGPSESQTHLLRQDLALSLLSSSEAKLAWRLTDFSPEETRKVRGIRKTKPKGDLLH